MREIRLVVAINRAAHEVFDFTINPDNTPKWIDGIVQELADETPAKLGTVYKNQGRDGNWREFDVTDYEPGVMFAMGEKGSDIHVKYTFKQLNDSQCELEYHVWVDKGGLDEPFTHNNLYNLLQKLKNILEAPSLPT